MSDIPTKFYWMGEDIDTMPAEKLRQIVRRLGRELEASRAQTVRVLDMGRAFARKTAIDRDAVLALWDQPYSPSSQ